MNLIQMLEFKDKLLEKLMNKEEKEDKKEFLKKEDYLLTKEKSLRKEKLTAKNGSKHSETMFHNLLPELLKKTSI